MHFLSFDFSHAMSSAASAPAPAATASLAKPIVSALMTSLFSPSPLSSSQSALAEAGVAAVSTFTVPAAYDPWMQNRPDTYSVMVHSRASSLNQGGFQAVVVLHPKSDLPPQLGLTGGGKLEETANLMCAGKNQPFLSYSQAPRASTMQVSVTEYLTLLTWVQKEWPRVWGKLSERAKSMRESNEPVTVAGHLAFYNHGVCHYRISLSSRLTFRAKSDSRTTREEDKVRAWLELRSGGSDGVQELTLPLEALCFLAGEESSLSALTEIVAEYKSRSRKRGKSVAGCH